MLNGDWSNYAENHQLLDFGAGSDFITFKIEFNPPITVDGTNNELFGVILNDDFSALNMHTARVGGIEISK